MKNIKKLAYEYLIKKGLKPQDIERTNNNDVHFVTKNKYYFCKSIVNNKIVLGINKFHYLSGADSVILAYDIENNSFLEIPLTKLDLSKDNYKGITIIWQRRNSEEVKTYIEMWKAKYKLKSNQVAVEEILKCWMKLDKNRFEKM